jgi:hypothetical protein
MAESEHIVLSDKNNKPDEALILLVTGDKMKYWKDLMEYVHDNYTGASGDWNYYNDGKQWIFKMTWKKKTIFWIVLVKESFRVTFYFGDKAEEQIFSSEIPQKLKDDFKNGKRYGKIRAISLEINDMPDIESVKKIAEIKVRMK